MATPTTVVDQVKWQVDRERGGRLTAAGALPVVVRLYREAWEQIINACRDRFVKTSSTSGSSGLVTLTGGASSSSWAIAETDFYALFEDQRSAIQKLDGDGTNWRDVPAHRRESSKLSYRWEGDTIFIEPPDDAAGTYRFRYVYKPADLTTVGSVIADFNGWIEAYLVDALTIRVRNREEEAAGDVGGLLQAFTARVQAYAASRAAPRRVIDVRSRRRRAVDDDFR